MQEIWKDIQGWEGIYQVSNLGKIKSLKRQTKNQFGKEDAIRKLDKTKNGYLLVMLRDGCKNKNVAVHRLVAQAFLANPHNYPVINHIDGVKTNNVLENLEWCTYSYNSKHNYKIGLQKGKTNNKGKFGELATFKRPVVQMDLNGNVLAKYITLTEACKATGADRSHMAKVCRGKLKKTAGYRWAYL